MPSSEVVNRPSGTVAIQAQSMTVRITTAADLLDSRASGLLGKLAAPQGRRRKLAEAAIAASAAYRFKSPFVVFGGGRRTSGRVAFAACYEACSHSLLVSTLSESINVLRRRGGTNEQGFSQLNARDMSRIGRAPAPGVEGGVCDV